MYTSARKQIFHKNIRAASVTQNKTPGKRPAFQGEEKDRYGAQPRTPLGISSLDPSRECPYTGIPEKGFLRAKPLKPPEAYAAPLYLQRRRSSAYQQTGVTSVAVMRGGFANVMES